jgi:hypothetical protein
MAATNLGYLVVPTYGYAGLRKAVGESVQRADYEGWVCPARRVEVSVDACVELHTVSAKPVPKACKGRFFVVPSACRLGSLSCRRSRR